MIDKSKQYKTRDGREVRIYATDGGGETVHGAVLYDGTYWRQHCWSLCGQYDINSESHLDLIEVKPRIKREVWVNVYPEWLAASAMAWPSKKNADEGAAPDRIACVRLTIDCEEGEGL